MSGTAVADDTRVEVERLLAMLEGEPSCELTQVTELTEWKCFRPARWIGQLHCGHPCVMCDYHYRMLAERENGTIICPCGSATVWSEAMLVGESGISEAFGRVTVTGPRPKMWPL